MFNKSIKYSNNTRKFFTIVKQYEKGIMLNFGKMSHSIEPGIRLRIPLIQQSYKVDMRENIVNLPKMNVVSLDNVTYHIGASLQYQIVDHIKSLLNVSNFKETLVQRCRMDLRNILGNCSVDNILENRNKISEQVIGGLSDVEDKWGVKIKMIGITDIDFDDSMKKAMSQQAEAERMAKAKIINASADVETAKKYNEAAEIYKENPITLRLREFQLWSSVSKNKGKSLFIIPSNLLDFIKKDK